MPHRTCGKNGVRLGVLQLSKSPSHARQSLSRAKSVQQTQSLAARFRADSSQYPSLVCYPSHVPQARDAGGTGARESSPQKFNHQEFQSFDRQEFQVDQIAITMHSRGEAEAALMKRKRRSGQGGE